MLARVKSILVCVLCLLSVLSFSQTIKGRVTSDHRPVSFANIIIEDTQIGVSSDVNGYYTIDNAPLGNVYVVVSSIGKNSNKFLHNIKRGVNNIDIELASSSYDLDQVVITGTKTFKRKTDSQVIVSVMDSRDLEVVQACNVAEALNFQPGVRVETDCQTCNYTQLRMNGLSGGYSQVLINGRAIFSALAGLYSMEQIPVNMIDRIEVVKGGGSALYGSSAIGGIVNIITKMPSVGSYSLGYDYARINSASDDKILHGNIAFVSEGKKSGGAFFVNNRHRDWYDHNHDNYSELPLLKDNVFGANLFFLPTDKQKLELSFSSMHEYRRGGEMLDKPSYITMQSEERTHDILLANIDYKIDFNSGKTSFVSYLGAQKTERSHYTGIRPIIGSEEDVLHLQNPPYGESLNSTVQTGFQLNHSLSAKRFFSNILTVGSEYLVEDVFDQIRTYDYLVVQTTRNFAFFLQSDCDLTENLSLLSGLRVDDHSFLNSLVFAPRFSLMYKIGKGLQFRGSYSTGFRAPQAFDSDLHIAFAGGGITSIVLDENLKEERSKSYSASINYDKVSDSYIFGFTLEGFYTALEGPFYQSPLESNEFGEVFVKRNGSTAVVKGLTLELRANLSKRLQVESSFTLQTSLFHDPVVYSDDLYPVREFLRTPNRYAYAVVSYDFKQVRLSADVTHTGSMLLLHAGGSSLQTEDEFVTSSSFNPIGLNISYFQILDRKGGGIEYSIGVKNINNSYQEDFDVSKNRDSNFIYGPSLPRVVYFGLALKSI